MTLPLFDPIELPPDTTLVDVNSLPDGKREECQGLALQLWIEDTGDADPVRDWDDNEGIFAVYQHGEIIGVSIITDVESI